MFYSQSKSNLYKTRSKMNQDERLLMLWGRNAVLQRQLVFAVLITAKPYLRPNYLPLFFFPISLSAGCR